MDEMRCCYKRLHVSDKVSRLAPGQHRLLQDVDQEAAEAFRRSDPELAAKEDYVDSLWAQKPRKMKSAGPVESISPTWVKGSIFSTEKVATLPMPTSFWARASRDGRYFAVQAGNFHVIDLTQQGKSHIELQGFDLDPTFTPLRFVTAGQSIPIDRIDRLSAGTHPLKEAATPRQRLGGYADPNSRIVVFSEHAPEADAGGTNPPDHLHSENRLLLAHWDDKKGENVGGPIFNVPGQWDFTVASDEPAVVGRFGPPDDNFSGPRDQSYEQTGYVIYDVNPKTLDVVPRVRVNTLRGGKAKLMDNYLAFAHAVEPSDYKLYGFDSPKDPKFQRLLKEKSTDIFVYDLAEKTHFRVTNSGPGKHAWSASFFRDEKGQPGLTYLFREDAKKTSENLHVYSPGDYSVHRAVLKQPLRDAALEEPIVDKVWNSPKFGERFKEAHRRYLKERGETLKSQHHAMHPNRKTTPGFLLEHRPMMRDFEVWLAKSEFADLLVENNGEHTLPAWRPNASIPKGIPTKDFVNTNPRLRTPDWVGTTEGTLSDPVFKRRKLEEFVTPYELGKSLTTGNTFGTGYHGAAHELLGGKMSSDTPHESPIFWLLHRHFDDILLAWLGTPNGAAWLKTQEGVAWAKTAQLPERIRTASK